jgi:hypothetical protein
MDSSFINDFITLVQIKLRTNLRTKLRTKLTVKLTAKVTVINSFKTSVQ